MSKFHVGQKCRVVKNALAPQCIGQEVTIVKAILESPRVLYLVSEEDGLMGYASEGCLEPIKENENNA